MIFQTPLVKSLLHEMTLVARHCYERGWSYGTAGNFSVLAQNVIWQSPTGWCKGNLRPEAFIPVDLETSVPLIPDGRKPSAEMPVHLGIYKGRAEARCVVHAHPLAVVRRTKTDAELMFTGEELAKHLGLSSHKMTLTIPHYENPTPEEMVHLTKDVQGWAQKSALSKMVILRGHGVYAWGATPYEALSYIEALEHLCLL